MDNHYTLMPINSDPIKCKQIKAIWSSWEPHCITHNPASSQIELSIPLLCLPICWNGCKNPANPLGFSILDANWKWHDSFLANNGFSSVMTIGFPLSVFKAVKHHIKGLDGSKLHLQILCFRNYTFSRVFRVKFPVIWISCSWFHYETFQNKTPHISMKQLRPDRVTIPNFQLCLTAAAPTRNPLRLST